MSTEFNEFNSIKIGIASPEKIRSWSYGEVKKPETINYRTLKPERDGLFCEKIFGPTKDWECHCGKYKKLRYKGKVCERCGVEITLSKVRRERMGHIELAAPVSHIWYFKGIPSRIGLVLDISPRVLERVLYFSAYIVTDVSEDITEIQKGQVLTEKEYTDLKEKYDEDFHAGMGAETIRKMLEEIDLEQMSKELREELESSTGQKRTRILKRLEVIDALIKSGNRPEWMILTVLPVIPPDIRPMVQLDGGRFATSDLNDLYRRVINRNNRLKRLLELHAPEIIVRNEKRMLQEAVDALIDNGRRGRAVSGPNNRPLKSLSEMLKGKQGRFRQNLLGKRVDYSGRSVIVVGPELKIYQCGLPKEMALELFKPFVMKKLVEMDVSKNIKNAKKMVERANDCVWDALETVIKNHPILLNRAPTLHRLGIQAFEPVLVEGRALKLHPLVCTAYNADFDGDQMAVHVPLSTEAQAEARFLMLSANNLLKPQDGKPVTVPTQDMVLGSYYLTLTNPEAQGAGSIFSCENEAMLAYDAHYVHIHAPIKVRMTKEINGQTVTGLVDTTIGKIIFNEDIPQDLGFVDRTKEENLLKPEIDFICTKKELGKIIDKCIKVHGITEAAKMLDVIKARGYKYSTKGAITMSVSDIEVPQKKYELIAEAEKKIDVITRNFRRGLISEDERYRLVIGIWDETTKAVTAALQGSMSEFNPINMMANSGARGSINQIRQLAGMRGLMANTSGKVIDIPIRANFREGLNVLEYFISSRGARKGLADTALRTADSGYLTRRLVDVAQDVIIRSADCGTDKGIYVFEFRDGNEKIEGLFDRLVGRNTAEDVIDPKTGEVICEKNVLMNDAIARRIVDAGIEKVKIRSLLTCACHHGVCAKCYGQNLATSTPVRAGEAVGIIAAQSIGEPGTQLTMRTFHTGGVALAADITQGLPRVEELFEARKPKTMAMLSEIAGKISIEEVKNNKVITVTDNETFDQKSYVIPFGARIKVTDGQMIEKGGEFTEGWANPHDILEILGPEAVQNYLMKEVQRAYRLQGVDINDKHIEVIVRQMMRKYKVEDAGSTTLFPNKVVDIADYENANAEVQARIDAGEEGLSLATATQTLMGITKASLATDSFMSAASFQETTRVLTEAAICGKVDHLIGLKENVIIGKLIPAGTGLPEYRNVDIVEKNVEEPEIIDVEY